MITEAQIRLLQANQAPEYEEPDPKLSPWQSGFIWFLATGTGVGILYLAGRCVLIAWHSIH